MIDEIAVRVQHEHITMVAHLDLLAQIVNNLVIQVNEQHARLSIRCRLCLTANGDDPAVFILVQSLHARGGRNRPAACVSRRLVPILIQQLIIIS
ncbi:hypothetical protein D3C78_830690 [compost metagenome]